MNRRYHHAASDYGIVEESKDAMQPATFVVYRYGTEMARVRSLMQARAMVEADRAAFRPVLTPPPAAGSGVLL